MAVYRIRPEELPARSSLHRFPLTRLLILGFFILIFLLCLKVLIDFGNLSGLSNHLRIMADKDIPKVHIVGQIRTLISDMENVILDILLGEPSERGIEKTGRIDKEITNLLEQYHKLQDDPVIKEQQILDEISAQKQALTEMTYQAVALLQRNEVASAEKMFLGPWEAIHHVTFQNLDTLLAYELQKVNHAAQQTDQLIGSARIFNAGMALVGILLSFGLAAVVLLSFSRPLADMLLAMERILRGEPVPPPPPAESATSVSLTRRFNEVLTWLHGSFEDSCHELRTSLTIIRGEAEVALRDPQQSTDGYREALVSITQVAQQMGRLVDDLVFLGRSQVGQIQYQSKPVDMSELLEKVAHQCQGLAALKEIMLDLSINTSAEVSGDFQRLCQLFVILLDNAIKYTNSGGHVGLALSNAADQVRVAISDSGIGISEKDLPNIFNRFYRVSNGRPRSVIGSGLGLAIAKSVVQAHRGEIIVDSTAGVGTTITIILPVIHQKDGRTAECEYSLSKTTVGSQSS